MTNFVFYTNPVLTLVRLPAGIPALCSLESAADLTGIHPEMIRHYGRLGLFGPARDRAGQDPVFDADGLYALRRIDHLRRHHGVNRQALVLLCALEREVERLESELRFLRSP